MFLIDRWRSTDQDPVCRMIHDFLASDEALGGALRASPQAVVALWEMGLTAAELGEPCLLVRNKGYVQWQHVSGLGNDLHTFGVWTEPSERGKSISSALVDRAIQMARAGGFSRVLGTVSLQNEASFKMYLRRGAWPTHVQVALRVN